ncbi:MAG: hypothetical protein ACLFU8_12440 [Anaerolineales bacterium]
MMKTGHLKKAALIWLVGIFLLSVGTLGCSPRPDASDVRVPKAAEDLEAFWDAFDWSDLTTAEQELWGVLGWNEASWQGEADEPASESKDWSALTAEEQRAAQQLGYDQAYWDSLP